MRRQDGFTLIEMIVVIIVMASIFGLVLVRQPLHSSGFDTDATVRALTNGLRLARSRAIAQNRTVPVITTSRGFSVDGAPPSLLPPGESLSESEVVFVPDGGSTGATILLTAGTNRIAVSVNWLTGRVDAGEARTR